MGCSVDIGSWRRRNWYEDALVGVRWSIWEDEVVPDALAESRREAKSQVHIVSMHRDGHAGKGSIEEGRRRDGGDHRCVGIFKFVRYM